MTFKRNVIEVIEYPPLSKITNRADVIFNNAKVQLHSDNIF